jgi:hypothetical protein
VSRFTAGLGFGDETDMVGRNDEEELAADEEEGR